MKQYPLLHPGVSKDGSAIVATYGDGKLLVLENTLDVLERRRRSQVLSTMIGEPWFRIPGKQDHQIVGEVDERKITAEMAAYAFNDADLLDRICGPGTYERVMPGFEKRVLEMARPLFATSRGTA